MLKKDYEVMAKYYDFLQQELDYNVWLEFLNSNMNDEVIDILEVGCGTGKFANLLDLKALNYDGFDLSEQMINEAKDKNLNANFFVEDARTFNLEKKYDVIICFMDTINYLTSEKDIQKAFKQFSKHLKPGGKVLFDIHQADNLENFSDYYEVGFIDELQYTWHSVVVNPKQKIVHHNFEFVTADGTIKEIHKQKIEELDYYRKIVKKDFKIEKILEDEYRHYFVLIKE